MCVCAQGSTVVSCCAGSREASCACHTQSPPSLSLPLWPSLSLRLWLALSPSDSPLSLSLTTHTPALSRCLSLSHPPLSLSLPSPTLLLPSLFPSFTLLFPSLSPSPHTPSLSRQDFRKHSLIGQGRAALVNTHTRAHIRTHIRTRSTSAEQSRATGAPFMPGCSC